MFQPAAQRYEHHQHGRGLEKRSRAPWQREDDGCRQHDHRIRVGRRGCHDDEDVHIGGAVLHRLVRLDVKIPTAEKLKRIRR